MKIVPGARHPATAQKLRPTRTASTKELLPWPT
jgi:hypothetical protein